MTVHVNCGVCGVEFCMPRDLHAMRERDGQHFYCINGHPISYSPSADQKRIASLEAEVEQMQRSRKEMNAEFDEVYAGREDLIDALKECPGRCGWRSRRQIPRTAVAMGRGIERVRLDVAEHLIAEHGAGAGVLADELRQRALEAGR